MKLNKNPIFALFKEDFKQYLVFEQRRCRGTFSDSKLATVAQALSLRCLAAPRARGDYVRHSVYWVTVSFLICTTTVALPRSSQTFSFSVQLSLSAEMRSAETVNCDKILDGFDFPP